MLFEILLIASQNWHVRIFITTPFSVYPAGQGRCNNISNTGVVILIVILLLTGYTCTLKKRTETVLRATRLLDRSPGELVGGYQVTWKGLAGHLLFFF